MLDINGNPYLLTESKTVIVRGSGCDIVIDDPGISRKHLEIDLTPNGVIARDLGSTNGTYVEGHQVPARRCWTAIPSPSAAPASCSGLPHESRSDPEPGVDFPL